jgi:hypothetical protein
MSSIVRRSPNAEVDACLTVGRVALHHVVALFVRDHFERQLVVVAKEERPLALCRDRRRLLEDVGDGVAVLHAQRHEKARHDGKVEGHVTLVAVAEVRDRILGPLVGLCEQHAIRKFPIDVRAKVFEIRVRFRQVFAVRAFAFEQIRNGV